MNHERILKLASVIEENPSKFDVGSWYEGPEIDDYMNGSTFGCDDVFRKVQEIDIFSPHCGTTGCFAGLAVALWPAEVEEFDNFSSAGARILGLNDVESSNLFYGQVGIIETAEAGVAHLRNMVAEDLAING